MNRNFFFFAFFAFAICFVALTSQAQAQASRTWVSGTGDDVNPCSRTAPCKTFAGAISKTADCGEIDALDPAGYGAITITKGIKIDGGGGEAGQVASILVSGTPGVNVSNSSATCHFVVLRNLDINGIQSGTTGVNVTSSSTAGNSVSLENVDVENFTGQCVDVEATGKQNVQLYNVNLENCTAGGIKSNTIATGGGVNRVNIAKSTIMRNGGPGVWASANSDVTVYLSLISGNGNNGALADAATAKLFLHDSNISNNQGAGVHSTNSAITSVTQSSLAYNNGFGFLADVGGQILTGNNNWLNGNASGDGARTGLLTTQ
ncbi:MAG TPA: right-handed parallel beta-helix repeat-containing protein [Candidatus Elarobacter sp.]